MTALPAAKMEQMFCVDIARNLVEAGKRRAREQGPTANQDPWQLHELGNERDPMIGAQDGTYDITIPRRTASLPHLLLGSWG
jgi:hypothetical protein